MAKDKFICKYKATDELAKLQCNLKIGNIHVIVAVYQCNKHLQASVVTFFSEDLIFKI